MKSHCFIHLIWIYIIFMTLMNKVFTELNDYLSNYYTLSYDILNLHNQHLRHKRSLEPIRLQFTSYNRDFDLLLNQDSSVFSDQAKLVFQSGHIREDIDISHIYRGRDLNTKNSDVFGSIINGIFSGRIDHPNETFFVEKYNLYFPQKNINGTFQLPHSIIYSETNVIYSKERLKKRSTYEKDNSCGISNSDVREWMNRVQHSAVHTKIASNNLYYNDLVKKRGKRNAADSFNRVCPIYIRTDYKLWDYFKKLNFDDIQAQMEITSLVTVHIAALNRIFEETTFIYKNMGPYNNISFHLQRLQIDGYCNGSTTGFCKPNIDVGSYLNLWSLTNHDDYCIAIAMTYRDFSGGTIGLAWVGSEDSSGGVCERWKLYQEINSYVNKSLNTAIFTLSNYGYRIPLQVSSLTVSHEIGHNFGSPHDNGPTCAPLLYNPNNPDGNYLMFASATRGTQKNNNVFSMCSIGNITLNLNALFRQLQNKVMCFKASNEGFCGNQIVDVIIASNYSEECDCGFAQDCENLNDSCCYPRNDGPLNINACRLKSGNCSPTQGPCCDFSCYFKSNSSRCKAETECSLETACNGSSSSCPLSNPKTDFIPCNRKTQVCKKEKSTDCDSALIPLLCVHG